MDYFRCEKCRRIFDEFEMDFKFAQSESVTLCGKCKDEYLTRIEFMKEFIDKQPKKVE